MLRFFWELQPDVLWTLKAGEVSVLPAEATLACACLPVLYMYFSLTFLQVKPSLASRSVVRSRDPLPLEPLACSVAESMVVGSLGGPNRPTKMLIENVANVLSP